MEQVELRVKVIDAELTNLEARVNALKNKPVNIRVKSSGVEAATEGFKKGAGAVKNYSVAASEAAKSSDTLIKNISKFTTWYLIGGAVSGVIRSFKDAVSTMKEVDTQLTNIQKVSQMTADEIERIGDKAYATASKYGVAADEYLSAVYTFQKAGLGDSAEQMGELATKTMLVGDTTADVASKFLIAVNAAWGLNGSISELSKVVDEADYINNNYATDLAKLSSGMPIVASTAANMNMSIEETLAVLGTITSKTQETGTKAATAWRALVMNITGEIGKITDEVDGDIEVTEESVKRIADALKIYGNEAVKTAQQTGQVIDPMEAVISLAEAYKDGLLTDIELENILMDVGGKLRTNQLTALVKDLASETSTYYDILANLPNAAGTADSEISTMLSSWESKTQILKNTWTEFIAKTINSDGIKTILDITTAVVDFADSLGLASTALIGLFVIFKGEKIIAKLVGAFEKLQAVALGTASSMTAASVSIGAVIAVAALLAMTINAVREAQQEARDEIIKNAQAEYDEAQSVLKLYAAYEDLEKQYKNGTADKGALEDATSSLVNNLNAERKEVDKLSGSYDDLAESLRNATIEKIQSAAYDALDARDAAEENIKQGIKGKYFGRNTAAIAEINIAAAAAGETDANSAQYYQAAYNRLITQRDQMRAAGQQDTFAYEKTIEALQVLEPLLESYNEVLEKYNYLLGAVEAAQNGTLNEYLAAKDAQEELADATGKATDAAKERKEAASEEAKAVKEVSASLKYQFKDIKQLEQLNGSLAKSVTQVGDSFYVEVSALGDVMDAEKQRLMSTGKTEAEATQIVIEQTRQRLQARIAEATAAAKAYAVAYGVSGSEEDLKLFQAQMQARADLQDAYISYVGSGSLASYGKDGGSTKTGGGSGSKKDAELENRKAAVELLKSELKLMQKRGDSVDAQTEKMREIRAALQSEIDYLRSIGGSEADINKLIADQYDIQNDILKLQKEQVETVKELIENYYDGQNEALKQQRDALEEARDAEKDRLSLAEKQLAVEKAKAALANAQKERTVRQYNASTGQWEWVADASTVEKAKEAYNDALNDLSSFEADLEYERNKAALDDNIERNEKAASKLEEAIQTYIEAMNSGSSKTGEAFKKLIDTLKGANGLSDELREQIVISLMKANAANYPTATDEMRNQLHNYNNQLGALIGATYDSNSGYWYKDGMKLFSFDGSATYDPTNPKNKQQKKQQSTEEDWSGVGTSVDIRGSGNDDAPSGLGGGTIVHTEGGDYQIVNENTPGAAYNPSSGYWSIKVHDIGGVLKGIGGIKATQDDELVLPPDITKKMLTPTLDAQTRERFAELRYLYGGNTKPTGTAGTSIGSQQNGDIYNMNGYTLTESQAKSTTVYDFVRMSRGLKIYNSTN